MKVLRTPDERFADLETWEQPFLTVFGPEDPVSFKPGAHLEFKRKVPGAAGQPHRVIQESASAELLEILDAFVHKA